MPTNPAVNGVLNSTVTLDLNTSTVNDFYKDVCVGCAGTEKVWFAAEGQS